MQFLYSTPMSYLGELMATVHVQETHKPRLHSLRVCRRVYLLLVLAVAVAGSGTPASPQDESDPATSLRAQANAQSMEAVPNRPTFSTTAETAGRGVFEIELGFESAIGDQDINGLFKFGLFRDLEIRLGSNPVVRVGGVTGFGDTGAGFKYRFLKDKGSWPTLAVLYTLTVPTSTAGPGNGTEGHSLGLLVSHDFGRHHLDFNESIQFLGRPDSSGSDRNYFTALSYSLPITRKFAFSEEIAGFSRTNTTAGASLTILQALTYSPSPRVVLDTGCYVAAMGDLPRATFFGGVTYSVADLYRHFRHPHH